MKLSQAIVLSFISVLFFIPSFTHAQTIEKSVFLSSGTILTSSSVNELQIELDDINQEIAYLERMLIIYQYYGMDYQTQSVTLELQDARQRQQQIIQTMSNISKVLHDTSLSIIRKIG